jgi:hypothetical protein
VFNRRMEFGMLARHGVRFRGPSLTRRTRKALSIAGISLLDRDVLEGWGGQIVEYVVSVQARDGDDAVARVRNVVSRDGFYEGFAPDPP